MPLVTLLILSLIIILVSKFSSDKGENFGHKVGGYIKDKSRTVGRTIGLSVGLGLGYLIVPETYQQIRKLLKEIPIFKIMPPGQRALFVVTLILLNKTPLLKKFPLIARIGGALALSFLVHTYVAVDLSGIIKNKQTNQPVYEKLIGDKNNHANFDHKEPQGLGDNPNNGKRQAFDVFEDFGGDGATTLSTTVKPEELTADQQKAMKKLVKKIHKAKEALISKIRLLGSSKEIRGFTFTINGEIPGACEMSYTEKIVDKQYGTTGIDTITYVFTFYLTNGQQVNFTIQADGSGFNSFIDLDIANLLAKYDSYEDQMQVLQTVYTLLNYTYKELEDGQIYWFSGDSNNPSTINIIPR